MITKFDAKQIEKITEYRDRYFRIATSTEPADRPRAENAALRMAEIAGVKIKSIHWFENPVDGASLSASLSDSLSDSLWDSLRASLSASLSASIWDSLSDSLRASLRASIWASLSDSLSASLRASIRDSLRDSLSDSLSASLWDTGWLAFYTYAVEVLDIECNKKNRELLSLHNDIAASCFAMWILPNNIILCDRPSGIKIVNGNVVDITWRNSK